MEIWLCVFILIIALSEVWPCVLIVLTEALGLRM